jgi:hypothetical protein
MEPTAGHELLKEVRAARKLKEIRFIIGSGPCRTGGSAPNCIALLPIGPDIDGC